MKGLGFTRRSIIFFVVDVLLTAACGRSFSQRLLTNSMAAFLRTGGVHGVEQMPQLSFIGRRVTYFTVVTRERSGVSNSLTAHQHILCYLVPYSDVKDESADLYRGLHSPVAFVYSKAALLVELLHVLNFRSAQLCILWPFSHQRVSE